MSVTGFAFLSPDSGGAALHTYYPLLTLMTLPSPCYVSERRPQTHRTSRLNHWATDTSLWWFLKECKRKKTRSYHLGSSSLTPDCEPSCHISPWTSHGGVVHSSWGISLLCFPLCQLRIKATFLFPLNSVSIFFLIWFGGQRKPRFWPAQHHGQRSLVGYSP